MIMSHLAHDVTTTQYSIAIAQRIHFFIDLRNASEERKVCRYSRWHSAFFLICAMFSMSGETNNYMEFHFETNFTMRVTQMSSVVWYFKHLTDVYFAGNKVKVAEHFQTRIMFPLMSSVDDKRLRAGEGWEKWGNNFMCILYMFIVTAWPS